MLARGIYSETVKRGFLQAGWWTVLGLTLAGGVGAGFLRPQLFGGDPLNQSLGPALLFAFALWLLFVAPSMGQQAARVISWFLAAMALAVQVVAAAAFDTHLAFAFPVLFLLLGQLFSGTDVPVEPPKPARRRAPKREAEPRPAPAPEADPAVAVRLRAIALQGQGKLDEAFEQFRQCTLDQALLDLLYNLALEYERKRRFEMAATVLHYIAGSDADYRDVKQRIRRAELMLETATGGESEAPAVIGTGPGEKMKLGRYEVQKELGKGAMGVVYLGRDPKIGRVVAIKTMQLSQEFDEVEIAEVKSRFFREAETAGKLTHPHIVTIYDAGEEHGLAYIAMELLRGHDLNRHVKPDTLLPVTTVIELVAQAADALDYAHSQGVVHRDIKPANLVYERARRSIKITDFGIARITDSTRTRTGLVLGTPSYMSPEQLKGKRIDGRSDIFSLGVTLYQMLTGQLPFRGDSMASLVKRIATESPVPANMMRTDLPLEIDSVLDLAMHKDPEQRYQQAGEFARALRVLHSEEGDLWV